MEPFLHKVAQSMPYALVMSAIALAAFTQDKWAVYFLVSYLVLGSFLNFAVKGVLRATVGDHPSFVRPSPPPTGSGTFDDCKGQGSSTYGMPSGHAQSMAFAAVFASLYISRQKQKWSVVERAFYLITIWSVTLAVCYSRVVVGCHTELQVAAGMLLGGVLGAGSYMIGEKWLK